MRDDQDRALETLCRPQRIDDGDFSRRVMRQINRRAWVRRALMPAALAGGAVLALRSLSDLLTLFRGLGFELTPDALAKLSTAALPQIGTAYGLAALAIVVVLLIPILDD